MEISKNRLILEVKNNENMKYRVIQFKRVFRISKDNREMSKFLLTQAGILYSAYEANITFGTLIAMINQIMYYCFFTITDNENLDNAIKESNISIESLKSSFVASFKQIGISDISNEEIGVLYTLINGNGNKIALLTGIPSAKHSKSGVAKDNPFNDSANTAEQQLEEFVKGLGTRKYLFMNIIKPVPYILAEKIVYHVEELQMKVEREAEYGESIGSSIVFPLGLNHGSNEGTSDGKSYGTNTGYNDSYSENSGSSLNKNTSTGSGYNEGDSFTINKGSSENIGISNGENYGYTKSYNEGYGINQNYSRGENEGVSTGFTNGNSTGETYNEGASKNQGTSFNQGTTENSSWNFGYQTGINGNYAETTGDNRSGSINEGSSTGFNYGSGYSANKGFSEGITNGSSGNNSGTNEGKGYSFNEAVNTGASKGESISWGTNHSYSSSSGFNESQSKGENYGFSKNISSGYNDSTGETIGWGKNSGQNFSENQGNNQGFSENFGGGTNFNTGYNEGTSSGKNSSLNWGSSTNEGVSNSKNTGINYNNSSSWGESINKGNSVSAGKNWSENSGTNFGKNSGINSGASYGFSPSINFGRNYTRKDYKKKGIAEILNSYREKIRMGLRKGNFFVTSFLITEDDITLEVGKRSMISAISGDTPIPAQFIDAKDKNFEKKYLASIFSNDYERIEGSKVRPFKYTTLINSQDLSALTHIPRIEFGGIRMSENIPNYRVPENIEANDSNLFVGHVIVPENGDVDYNRNFYVEAGRGEMNHGIISGTTGSGKSVLAMRYITELALKKVENYENAKRGGNSEWLVSGIVIDWKKDWRSLLNILPKERVAFYTLGDNLKPLHTNLVAVPKYVTPFEHFSSLGEAFCLANGLGSKANQMLYMKLVELCSWEKSTVLRIEEYLKKIKEVIVFLKKGEHTNHLNRPAISFISEAVYLEKGLEKILELKGVLKDLSNGNSEENRSIENSYFDSDAIIASNSRKVTLEHLYFLYEAEKIFKRHDGTMQSDMAEAYERLTERLRVFVGENSMLNKIFCYNYEDMVLIPEVIEEDKITILEGAGIKSNNEIKKFVTYLITSDIYNYAATKDSVGETFGNLKVLVFEEALDIMPTKEGNANKQVLDIPIDIYERLWTQGRGYGLRGIAIVQHIGHLKEAIISSSPTSFFMKTELPQDMETIVARLGKVHSMEVKDVEFKKFLPLMPQGWVIHSNTASIKGLGLGEPILFKAKQIEVKKLRDDEVMNKIYKDSLY